MIKKLLTKLGIIKVRKDGFNFEAFMQSQVDAQMEYMKQERRARITSHVVIETKDGRVYCLEGNLVEGIRFPEDAFIIDVKPLIPSFTICHDEIPN